MTLYYTKLNFKITLLSLCFYFVFVSTGWGQNEILGYISSNSPGSIAASFEEIDVTGFDLSRGTGISQATGGTYNSNGWTTTSLLSDAKANNDYLEWGFSSSSPYDLTTMDIRYDRSGSGPETLTIEVSINGGTFQSVFSDVSVSSSGENNGDIDLSAFTNVSSATFRMYGYNAAASSGTFDIENTAAFQISGTDYGIILKGISATPAGASTLASSAALVEPPAISVLNTAFSGAVLPQRDAVANFDFTFTDDNGSGGDSDPTQISQIVFNAFVGNGVTDWSDVIAEAQLSDGTNTATTTTVGASSITFASLPNTSGQIGYIVDNASKTYTLTIRFKTNLTNGAAQAIDGQDFVFVVNNSSFSFDTGGLAVSQSVDSGDANNRVSVVATILAFDNTFPFDIQTNSAFSLTVNAVDVNGNLDKNSTASITLTRPVGSGTLTGTLTQSLVDGTIDFADLQVDAEGIHRFAADDGVSGLSASPISGNVVATSPDGCLTELIISEYGEGSSGNSKYIEIYNGTGNDVDLSNYRLWKISNGGSWPETTYDFPAMTTLAKGTTYVLANNSTDVPSADDYDGFASWNGDDAVGLAKNISSVWTLIDAVGTDGADPGTGWDVAGITDATVDSRLIRKATVTTPTTDWTSSAGTNTADSEWEVISYTTGAANAGHADCFTTYYYTGTGSLEDVNNWGANTDGSGTNPVNFINNFQAFEIANTAAATLSNVWTISGKDAQLTIPSGTTLTVDNTLLEVRGILNNQNRLVASGANPTLIFGGTITGTGTITGSTSTSLTIEGSEDTDFGTLSFTSGSENLASLTVDRGSSGGAGLIKLGSTLSMAGDVSITNGDLDLNGNNLILNGTTNSVSEDLVDSDVIFDGTATTEANQGGYIQVSNRSVTVSTSNIGGLGLVLNHDGSGSNYTVDVKRYHYSAGGGRGIKRIFDIDAPATVPSTNLRINYAEDELVGTEPLVISRWSAAEGWNAYIPDLRNDLINFVQRNGITAFSAWTASSEDSALPVTLLSFYAKNLQNNQAELLWQTASEKDNKGFVVEKSLNAEDFEAIVFVDGAGQSSEILNYTFIDTDFRQSAYYRLKQIDFDGSFTYSQPVFVEHQEAEKFKVYPNPISSNQKLNIDIAQKQDLSFTLSNTQGKIILQARSDLERMRQSLEAKISELEEGLYILKIQTLNKIYTQKLILR